MKIINYEFTFEILNMMKEQKQIDYIIQEIKSKSSIKSGIKFENGYESEDFDKKLTKCLSFIINKIIPIVNNDKFLFLISGYLLNNKLAIIIESGIFEYSYIDQFGNYDLEIFKTLHDLPSYVSIFVEMISEFFPMHFLEILKSKNYNIIPILKASDLRLGLENISHKSQVRVFYFLIDILKKMLNDPIRRNDLIDVIIDCFHIISRRSMKREYLYEVNEIIELSVICPSLFQKLINLELNNNDLAFLSNYSKECQRLMKEFERVLNHPSLKEESRAFYENEIIRLNQIRKISDNVADKIVILKNIREKCAARRIQNAWFSYVEKICHPNHPKMLQRFEEWKKMM